MAKGNPNPVRQQARKFIEIAAELGYCPAEHLVRTRIQVAEELRMLEDGEIGTMRTSGQEGVRHLGGGHNDLIAKFRRELFELDKELMPYAFPKLKATESEVEVSGDITVKWDE